MPVRRIASKEDAATSVALGHNVVDLPGRDFLDPERHGRITDRFANVALEEFFVGRTRRPSMTEKEGIPFSPGRHARPDAHPDLARRRGNKGEPPGQVPSKARQIRFEPHADRLADVETSI